MCASTTATGRGGNPDKEVIYLNVTPAKNDDSAIYTLSWFDKSWPGGFTEVKASTAGRASK